MMGVRYDYQGNLIDGTPGTSATNGAVFGAITRTIEGSGDADSWSLSKSQRSQVMGSDRWDIEQEMTINQHEDFDGSMVYTKSPKVELVDGLPALQYDESLVTDIDASGEYSPSDHVVVKHNGAVIYDAVQGTPIPYSYATDAFAFEDNFDTVGNIAPRVGPSHGPGGEAAQIFAGATVFPGDNPGTTTSSWQEYPSPNQDPASPPPAPEQPFRPWKSQAATYDIDGTSILRKGGAVLVPGEEPVEGIWLPNPPAVPQIPSDDYIVETVVPPSHTVAKVASVALDIAGIPDPSGVADVFSAGLQLATGEFVGAALTLPGLLPIVGDSAKMLKVGMWVRTIREAMELAAKDTKLMAEILPYLQKIREAISALGDRAGETLQSLGRQIDENINNWRRTSESAKQLADGSVQFKRWKRGDAIDKPMPDGSAPTWETVQSRYWKNRYEASRSSGEFSPSQLAEMRKGNAPMDYNPRTREWERRELHHVNAQRHVYDNSPLNLRELTPDWHAEVDPFRRVTGILPKRGIR